MEREPAVTSKTNRLSSNEKDPHDVPETNDGAINGSFNNRKRGIKRLCSIAQAIFAWTFGVLVLLFISFIAFGVLYSGIRYPEGSGKVEKHCLNPVGAILGAHEGVFSYSNCGATENTTTYNNVTVAGTSYQSGLKWQCVEYARRYWMLRGTPQPATFGSVDGAADIWDLKDVQLLNGQKRKPLLKYHNGNATSANSKPRVGDLLIYPRQPNGFPCGHVAVVAGVTGDRMFVAEQNWENAAWPGPYHNYSRVLNLSCNPNGTACTVREKDNVTVQGWVRYE
ncbi:D-alanyl-glycyl endopeptidase-like protein [Trypanosoma brucei brucei TREU927]|uniref:D-alanyl-glycyl endopeptidase-like protein n=1 Tax=Trypanosoma brucei brucei (strain 927/4 GUTat10.1) TaxID=185431 RepID=Q586Y1_TRYB2|nr:D-alanyl-glycyl endopeptidase-like protein [Trypanosoma brucei brucei TREU927]AAQ15803.1 D-alanyl-glycyl endopeptidase-like protein [Trypanosoma brucei brucei TREU927]AAX79610.1 D-alanyl-glycyl endopeptidase-like protein [Trypanosoma brucei]